MSPSQDWGQSNVTPFRTTQQELDQFYQDSPQQANQQLHGLESEKQIIAKPQEGKKKRIVELYEQLDLPDVEEGNYFINLQRAPQKEERKMSGSDTN